MQSFTMQEILLEEHILMLKAWGCSVNMDAGLNWLPDKEVAM